MNHVFVMLNHDRHADPEVKVFKDQQTAEIAAQEVAARWEEEDIEEYLNDSMKENGWTLYIEMGSEGDCVRVQKVKVDE